MCMVGFFVVVACRFRLFQQAHANFRPKIVRDDKLVCNGMFKFSEKVGKIYFWRIFQRSSKYW